LAVLNIKFQHIARRGTGVNDAMEQTIGNAPLLLATHQADGFVIEPQYPAAALLMVAIDEPDHVTDSDFVATQSPLGLFPDFDISAIEVDRCI
jgi:hypothetical protein